MFIDLCVYPFASIILLSLIHKDRAPKNWWLQTVVMEKTPESPLDCKEIQPVHSKDQSWVFFESNDAKAETPVLWLPHVKRWLIGKDSDAGRDLGKEEKGTTEDEMAGWHHRLDGREFEWTLGVGDGQGGLACCYSHSLKESDTTQRLNWTELNWTEPKLHLMKQNDGSRIVFHHAFSRYCNCLQKYIFYPKFIWL